MYLRKSYGDSDVQFRQSEGSRSKLSRPVLYVRSAECASAHTFEGEYEPENLRGWSDTEILQILP